MATVQPVHRVPSWAKVLCAVPGIGGIVESKILAEMPKKIIGSALSEMPDILSGRTTFGSIIRSKYTQIKQLGHDLDDIAAAGVVRQCLKIALLASAIALTVILILNPVTLAVSPLALTVILALNSLTFAPSVALLVLLGIVTLDACHDLHQAILCLEEPSAILAAPLVGVTARTLRPLIDFGSSSEGLKVFGEFTEVFTEGKRLLARLASGSEEGPLNAAEFRGLLAQLRVAANHLEQLRSSTESVSKDSDVSDS